ncbi:hypothetical protein [Rugosimonospora africana]|uniref:Uncharacterized protein n=1 Tax=Rugosimonospora africana TaxID=556532 RepID=A0A8J3VNR3_9ACTN|nr:hypothetical protein [Rugosimonospora africana]GIH12493.1 hypothetical protein Raf01_06650 [Rugosimonospora africana]
MADETGIGDGDNGLPGSATGAGFADTFRVEFTPTSRDKRFGTFQLYVRGIPLGDGSTTAPYPHYRDFCHLCALAERPGPQHRRRSHLGDTFDHLDMYIEMTELDVVFTLTTRAVWGAPPPWAPPVGTWLRPSVPRSEFISTWNRAAKQLRSLLALP